MIYEPSRRRVADALAERVELEVLVMDEAGALTLDGQPLTGDDPAPTIAWATHDVFTSPVARHFVVLALKSPTLRWVQSASAGVDSHTFVQLLAKGVRLTTSHGQSVAMADYVLDGVLDHFQRGPARRAAQAAGDWRRIRVREILNTRWLIVGFGAVGQAVATRARSFGARVTGARRNPAQDPLADAIVAPDRLVTEAPNADVVVLCAPLTPATHHVVDAAFLAAMKEDSVLVNVARGGLIDEAALLAALDVGRPARAVLDVFETEPLPADSPFWRHPRVTLTAHTSGVGNGQDDRNADLFLENLSRYLAGEALLNEVPPVAGTT